MKTLFQFLFLWLVWEQVTPPAVSGWEVWSGDCPGEPFYLEATVTEPRYRVTIDKPMKFFEVAAVNEGGRTFAVVEHRAGAMENRPERPVRISKIEKVLSPRLR